MQSLVYLASKTNICTVIITEPNAALLYIAFQNFFNIEAEPT